MAASTTSPTAAAATVKKQVEQGLADGPWSFSEHGKKCEAKLKSNPYDLECWNVLVREAQSASLLRARMLYERLVTQFPTSGRYWRLYIEHEMRNRNYEQVEELFQRCLMKILNIDLWKCYVTYVRETKSSLPNFRVKMKQAYDFAAEHVGIDFHSTTLWADYINFLKSEATSGSYAETQKTNSIRKAYHQVVMTPLMNIEQMWRDYCNFEQMSSKAAAKRNIDAVSRAYVHSKRASAELETCTRGLIRGATSVPLLGTVQEIQQLKIWKQFIAWEKRNPTRTESNALLVKRVLYAYEQCLLCYSHCAEIWYETALYLQRASETGNTQFKERWAEEAAMLYERATTVSLSNSLLLHFAFADFEESRLKFDKAEAIYKKLLEKKDIQPTLVFVQYMKFSRRTEGIKAARNVFKQAREDPRCSHQIYVAAALMEYNISKDKAISYKIFELGLKKFSDDPTYVLAYLDHLSHLNEDNNTRVLFEKVLATMPAEKTKEVWDKYVEFESNVGDLASLLKVEKKRAAAMRANSKMDPSQCREALLLVDRYSYLGLIPCSETELRVMEHPYAAKVDLEPASGSSGLQSTRAKDTIAETSLSGNISRPDTSHMLPFRPSATSGVGMNAVPGGHFPLPSEVAYLMSRTPPPQCFNGPFVNLNELVHLIKTSDLPSSLAPGPPDRLGKKRRAEGRDDSDDETQSSTAPPTNDIYRARQQKRAHTDKAISYKIFELGLKKFSDDPTYVLAYLDHLSHLNEDNNTRVLFEKVLATMPAEKTKEVWDKYVEFESNVGDLASLLKVEKKRAAAMRANSKMDPSQCREALLLVDRYSYLGLIPCSETELRVMEHPYAAKVDLEPASGSSGLQSTRAKDTIAETSLSGNISRPDTSHMLPFRPSATSGVGMNAVPGGHFPLPSEVAYLMSRTPPPQCFNGPFVNLNELVHLIKTSDLPSSLAPGPPDRLGKKRRAEGRDDSDDETQSSTAPPTNDIYRARQQKRAHTVNSS